MPNIQLDHAQHQPKPIRFPLCFLAHDLELAVNVGSLFRIADAFGVEKIYLTGSSPAPPNPKVRKAARSCDKRVDFQYEKNPHTVVNRLKADGYQIVSLEITTTSIDIRQFVMLPPQKIALVVGSENTGICQELLDVSDQTLHIPMLGQNSSMNVAMAAAIATFEMLRRLIP